MDEKMEEKLKRIAEELESYMECKDCPMEDRCPKGFTCARTLYEWLKEI